MITITHTSPTVIERIDMIGGCACNGTLFFSTNDYAMGNVLVSYDMELSDDEIVAASQLHDDEIISEIADLFDVDNDTAESLLDASHSELSLENCDGDKSCELQGLRAECAQKMGFIACEDRDENGTVYMIKMNNDLLARMIAR